MLIVQAMLIEELRTVATAIFQQKGSTVHSKLLGRAICALIDEKPRFRAAIASELDLLALTKLTPAQRDLIIQAAQQLRSMDTSPARKRLPQQLRVG